ncbi:MAG: AAA family ATPase [Candidatus Nanopelagicales bacterium]
MALALYRKYRPGRFDDVIGQEHVTEPLKRAIDSDRVHHAYLFSGPRGCGKTSSARILARSSELREGADVATVRGVRLLHRARPQRPRRPGRHRDGRGDPRLGR